jgi:ABC-type nitrate/sulfonate/bicarbonate transport system substrate-binding protein
MQQRAYALRAISLAILSTVFTGAAGAEDLVKVAVPQRGTWETSVPDLGEEAKIFAKQGLKVERLYTSGGGETMQALISGSVDVAIATGAAAMFAAYAKGAPIRPIGTSITGAREIFWYVKADSPIKSLKDAAGKTMAFSATGSSSNLATLKLIKMAGVDIKPVATGTPVATFTQTMTGQVDIGWSAAPFALSALQEHRIRTVANVGDIVEYRDMSARFHLANLSFITGKPDVLKRFLAAYSETLDWMYGGDEAIGVFSKLYNIKPAETRQTRDEFYTRQSLDIRRVGGLDRAMEDAVAYKFIGKPLTKTDLDDLFKYQAK